MRLHSRDPAAPPKLGRMQKAGIALLAIIAVLIAIRIALTPILLRLINGELNEIPGYRGQIEDVDLNLYRGAYRIDGIVIENSSGKVPVPFFKARHVDLSIEWGALLHGSLVCEIVALGPELNFVMPPPGASPKVAKEQGQIDIDESWTEKIEDLAPFEINRFRIREGQIHFRDFHRRPRVDIHLDHLEAEATGLTNARNSPRELPAEFHATGRAMGHADLRIDMKLDPLANHPTFDVNAQLTGLRLTELNDFFRAYAKVDVESGALDLFTEAAASEGSFKGYVKPMMKDLKVLNLEDEEEGLLKLMWEAIVAGVTEVLENQPKEQVATQIPIQGKFSDPKAGIWRTVGWLFRNAFLQALKPSFSNTIGIGDVKGGKPAGKSKPD